MPWGSLALGVGLSALIGCYAYRRESLTRGGVCGAIVVGALLFGFGGPSAGLLLIAFFMSSSALSHARAGDKALLAEKFSKGSRRDLAQVLANGGVAAALALPFYALGYAWLWAGVVGALAAVNADTWATEVGVLARSQPRMITSGRQVEVGTSGAITARGTLAALAGALLIGALAGVGWIGGGQRPLQASALAALGVLAGLAGALFDSLLGATVQAIYFCEACGKETESHPIHRCGAPTRQIRGCGWLSNDWVNFLSSGLGALIAAAAWGAAY